jgi:hypothetical protein
MALDTWPGLPEAVEELGRALPDLDLTVLDNITAFRHRPDRTENPEPLRQLLREAMMFLEDLNDRLVARLRDDSLPQSNCEQLSAFQLSNSK